METIQRVVSGWRVAAAVVVLGCIATWFAFEMRPASSAVAAPASSEVPEKTNNEPAAPIRVETVKPQPGGIERTTTQPGTVIAFESARLFAKISGYLKSQAVDIG